MSLSRVAALLWLLPFFLTACQSKSAAPSHPKEAQVRRAIDHYFASWSAQNMEAYGQCFHPQARIFMLETKGALISQGLSDFLHGQRMAHAQSPEPMKEVPVETRIQMDDTGAQAYVTWLLTRGSSHKRGVDLFTFKREGNDWKIVSLVFYGE